MHEIVAAVLTDEAPRVTAVRGDVPTAVEAAILRCLEKDRNKRFQSVAELAEAIAPFGSDSARASARRIASLARPADAPAPPATRAGEPRVGLQAPPGVATGASWSGWQGTMSGAKRRAVVIALAVGASALVAVLVVGFVVLGRSRSTPAASGT